MAAAGVAAAGGWMASALERSGWPSIDVASLPRLGFGGTASTPTSTCTFSLSVRVMCSTASRTGRQRRRGSYLAAAVGGHTSGLGCRGAAAMPAGAGYTLASGDPGAEDVVAMGRREPTCAIICSMRSASDSVRSSLTGRGAGTHDIEAPWQRCGAGRAGETADAP